MALPAAGFGIWCADMNDAELEAHIEDLGLLMVAAYSRYEVSGCFADRGEADGWRLHMEEAIASRSPAQVARMDVERGLATS